METLTISLTAHFSATIDTIRGGGLETDHVSALDLRLCPLARVGTFLVIYLQKKTKENHLTPVTCGAFLSILGLVLSSFVILLMAYKYGQCFQVVIIVFEARSGHK